MTDAEGVDVMIESGVVLRKPLAKVRAVGANGIGKVGKREVRVAEQQFGFALITESFGNVYALVGRVDRGHCTFNALGGVFMGDV